MRESGSGTRKAVQKLFDEHGISIKVKLEIGSNEAIKQAIAGGLGISVLSLHTLALEGTTSQLTILEVEDFPIQLYWSEDKLLTAALLSLVLPDRLHLFTLLVSAMLKGNQPC